MKFSFLSWSVRNYRGDPNRLADADDLITSLNPDVASIVFSRWTLEVLIYALFISLHGYPERRDEERPVFETRFLPFEPDAAEDGG